MYWHEGAMNGWMFVVMLLIVIPLWFAVIAAIVVVLRASSSPSRYSLRPTGNRSPAGILAERFATGELDETEYRRRLAVLGGDAPTGEVRSPAGVDIHEQDRP
ncbi:SHOCT domain-containing protein [Nocardia sp. CWNU-33]|uniref:SHOCT domain-containing protein n=1 Tax=Nocardia sp. CWNU-33 TaxID=3392117 RepID=UPI00398F6F61